VSSKSLLYLLAIATAACLLSFLLSAPAYAYPATASGTPVPDVKEVELGNVTGAIVTLYYYDPSTGGKGDIVKIPENPQHVQWNESVAAPGTYTFTHVPEGTHYIEAVHDNRTWFAIASLNQGTTTANVAIPPQSNWNEMTTQSSTPPVLAAPANGSPPASSDGVQTASQLPTPAKGTPQTSGAGIVASLVIFGLVVLYILKK